jgi:hypothetical protein
VVSRHTLITFSSTRARAKASLFWEREYDRSRNVEGMTPSVSGKEKEEARGPLLRGSLMVGSGMGWLLEVDAEGGGRDWRDEWE